mgnify:FL=1
MGALLKRISNIYKRINMPLAILLSCVFICILIGYYLITYSPGLPRAEKGYLYCSSIDNRRPVMLNGEWEFYPNTFLFPSDFNYDGSEKTGRTPEYVIVPNPAEDTYGYGTYRLRFKFISRSQLFALKITDISSSARIYVDGVLIGSIGDPSTLENGSIPWSASRFIVFPMDTLKTMHEIIIQTSNYNYYHGGIISPIFFGTQTEVYQLTNDARLSYTVAVMSIFVLTVFLLFLFPLRIQMRNIRYLLCFTFCFGLFLMTKGEKFILSWFGEAHYLEFTRFSLSLYVLMGLFILLYINMQPGRDRLKIWLYTLSAAGGVLFLCFLFTPQGFQHTLVRIGYLYNTVIFVLSVIGLIKRILHRSYGALFQLLGLIAWSLLFVVFYTFDRGMLQINARNWLLIILSFGFVICQILYISLHIASVYSANVRLANRMVVSDKLKKDFIEITSHELRTPLHGIVNITQSVISKFKDKHAAAVDKEVENLELVVTLAHHMIAIVNDMYQYVGATGNVKSEIVPIDLHVEVKSIFEMFTYTLVKGNIHFVNRISPKASLVYADDRKLWQVLNNLIGNALKYTDSGTITVESCLKDGKVHVSVIDTGIGIPAEETDVIFEKSTRLSSGRQAEGLGLGLYVARKLVEEMNGEIFVEWTKPNVGTKITFTLPMCDPETFASFHPSEQKPGINVETAKPAIMNLAWPSGSRILVVDDNPDNLKVLTEMFNDPEIVVDTAHNGQEALDMLTAHSYDTVILDIMMPGMSGFEVCKAIRSQYSIFELPVLILTARNDSAEILTGFWAGANDYVIKPVGSIELRARIFTLITLKHLVNRAIKNEMSFLQAQIRPHFIYNALNTISAVALSDGPLASELIDNLSTYLRYSFHSGSQNDLVTIKEEIELVESYIKIEEARFGDRLEVTLDIQPDLNFSLPPLTIQPLVENAVRHGSLHSSGKTRIAITMYRKGNDAVIEITDNGPGVDIGKVQTILESEEASPGIGLYNVHRRLKLRYNRGLEIDNLEEGGTRVTIKIPL